MNDAFSAWRFAKEHRHLLVIGLTSLAALGLMAACCAILVGHIWSGLAAGRTPLVATALCAFAAVVLEAFSTMFGRQALHANAKVFDQARLAKEQTDQLFHMTDMLQSADGHDDATAVLMATSLRLLPDFGGALYIFNNSRDRLDLAGSWNMPDEHRPAETLAPSNCWTLKRGKAHVNHPRASGLSCAHHTGHAATLELPMLARGSVHGLLVFATTGDDEASARLAGITRLGQAMADSMSLALSNISLHEKLRTQSLRDPLTGLYNRRYMEDALERFVSLAERSGAPTSVLMLDLDNFKQLNDQLGHAKGDAVLREVATQLVAGVRPSDVVCRYGGEELMVILPDCSLEDAVLKAENLRLRVESLSELHDISISVSIGVASIPATSAGLTDIVPMADAALYQAKHAGKNCVVCAQSRAGRADPDQPKLALAV